MGIKYFFSMILTCLAFETLAINLWKNDDQIAYEYFQNKSFAKAKQGFRDNGWKASSAFRDKDYDMALKYYQEIKTPDGFYNLGNTFAFKGDIKAAIAAYQHTLALDSTHQDAKHNLDILKKYQDKQKQDKQKQDKQNQDKQKQDKQNQDKQNQDKQNQDKQNQDKQNQDKQNQDKQNQDNSLQHTDKEQAKEDWMKFIQEDPAGLLRQKFRRDYQRAQEEGRV
ncbi:MAG: hypothetical protein EBY16_03060 [Gammaproteobacteria bacterium]|nr:hypothetical protein [Gammaproteobacteria bacterium]